MTTKTLTAAKTLVKGTISHNLYDYLNTGSMEPTEIKIPYVVKTLDKLFYWEAQPPTGKIKSSYYKNYDKCLEDLQNFIDQH
jgi:hypothetical protein